MQTINLNGQNYKIKFSFRAIKNFEDLANKPITQCITTWDNLLFLYATLKAENPNFTLNFDEFNTAMDDNPELLIKFQTADVLGAGTQPGPEPAQKKSASLKMIFGLWMLLPLFAVSPALIPIISIIAWILTNIWLLVRLIKIAGSKRAQLPRRSATK